MRTRKTFIHEDGIYEGMFRLPEPNEIHSKEIVSINDSYDWYPEKEPIIKLETVKFEEPIEIPLGIEYNLQSQIENYSKLSNRDT